MNARKLLDEIVEKLSNDGGSLTDALMRAKVLLHKIGRKDLAEWVNLEVEGYGDGKPVPDYRLLHGEVRAHLSGINFNAPNYALPTLHLDKKVRDNFQRLKMRMSVAAMKELISDKEEGQLQMPIPIEASRLFRKTLTPGTEIHALWSSIGVGQVTQILTQVRSRLLDFVLELSEKIEDKTTDEEARQIGQSPETGALFAHAVFGDNVVIQVGTGNVQSVSIQVAKGDFEALAALLAKNKMAKPDIDALQAAIEDDSGTPEVAEKRFGPKVQGWMKTMWSKAVDTSWAIELGVVGNLLTDGLKGYYGR